MHNSCLKNINVVILGGGLGTRLVGELNGKPKLLAPIAGTPYLDLALNWLISFGAQRVILALGHLGREVEQYVSSKLISGIEIICAIEPEPLGTAGGLAFVSSYIKSDTVLVMNGDIFVDVDLCALLENHQACSVEATILCTSVPNVGRYGMVEIDKLGRVVSFREKDDDRSHGRINAGVYVMSKSMIRHVQTKKRGSLETDVFPYMPLGSLNAYCGNFDFIDFGTPEAYARAPELFESQGNRWSKATL